METTRETVCTCWELCENGATCRLTGAAALACQRSDAKRAEALRAAIGGMYTVGGAMGRAASETR